MRGHPGLKIIGDVDPNDVHQGVGNCWLLAISALAEFDGAVYVIHQHTRGLRTCRVKGPTSTT